MLAKTILSMAMAFVLILPFIGWCEDVEIAKSFSDRKVQGALVLSSLDGSQYWVHNDRSADTPFVPASTFKILNTLIALDSGVIDEKQVLKWDSEDRGIKAWNRDHTLETAFKTSCVWFFQELARRIGTEKYRDVLNQVHYGNAKPGPNLETFWLDGDLKISAKGQIEFLKRLYHKAPPFRNSSYESLKRIMIIERKPAFVLRGKTGWAGMGEDLWPQIGWFVGYVEKADETWFFAINIDINKLDDARYRQEIALEALNLKGALE